MAWPELNWVEAIGYLGSLLVLIAAAMKTMIPLRILSILASIAMIVYGALITSYPVILSEAAVLPIDVWRLIEMICLVRRASHAKDAEIELQWLSEYGKELDIAEGDVLFRKGDRADAMYYTAEGEFVLVESGIVLGPGNILGELGLFSNANARTQTLKCTARGKVFQISYADVKQLYYQNPQFGFYLLNLVSRRMFENNAKLEMELEEARRLIRTSASV